MLSTHATATITNELDWNLELRYLLRRGHDAVGSPAQIILRIRNQNMSYVRGPFLLLSLLTKEFLMGSWQINFTIHQALTSRGSPFLECLLMMVFELWSHGEGSLLIISERSWTTSDIDGLNSGTDCENKNKWERAREIWKHNTNTSKCESSHLNAARYDISKPRQGFGRILPLNRRIDHSGQCIDVMELRDCPSNKKLLSSIPWPENDSSRKKKCRIKPHPETNFVTQLSNRSVS